MRKTPDPRIYRAKFHGLRPLHGALNMAVPCAFTVEVFEDAARWKARYDHGARIYGIATMHHADCQKQVELMFSKQVEQWEEIKNVEEVKS